jgi:hypothetical protein
VIAATAAAADLPAVKRRNRAEPAVPAPDRALMRLVETTGAAVRSASGFRRAVGLVLDDVAVTAGWQAAHAWVPADTAGVWRSYGLWYPDDGIGLGGLRTACCDSPPVAPRGHLALALHMESTQWAVDLGPLAGTPVHDAATGAGIVSAVACPVYAHDGRAVALLEWFLGTPRPPSPDVAHVLGHLSSVLTEVYERPPTYVAPPVEAPRATGRMRVSFSMPAPRRPEVSPVLY